MQNRYMLQALRLSTEQMAMAKADGASGSQAETVLQLQLLIVKIFGRKIQKVSETLIAKEEPLGGRTVPTTRRMWSEKQKPKCETGADRLKLARKMIDRCLDYHRQQPLKPE